MSDFLVGFGKNLQEKKQVMVDVSEELKEHYENRLAMKKHLFGVQNSRMVHLVIAMKAFIKAYDLRQEEIEKINALKNKLQQAGMEVDEQEEDREDSEREYE